MAVAAGLGRLREFVQILHALAEALQSTVTGYLPATNLRGGDSPQLY